MAEFASHDSFWKKLVEGEGSFRTLRTLFLLIFFSGTLFFGWSFKKVVDLSEEESIHVDMPENKSQEEAIRLDGVIQSFKTSVEARYGSKALAASMIKKNRRPFISTRPSGKGGSAAAIGDIPLVEPLIAEPLPPIMFVRAIMVVGKESIAIMDINGVGNGIIVKTGYSFLDKQGRIMKITPEKVTVSWAGKNIDITPGF